MVKYRLYKLVYGDPQMVKDGPIRTEIGPIRSNMIKIRLNMIWSENGPKTKNGPK